MQARETCRCYDAQINWAINSQHIVSESVEFTWFRPVIWSVMMWEINGELTTRGSVQV